MQVYNSASFGPTTNPNVNVAFNGQQMNVTTVPVFTVPLGAPQPTVIPQFTHSSLFHQIFLKGKPRPLGIVLIVTGVLQVALGIAGVFTIIPLSVISGITFWGPVFYIIAGSLTIAAQVVPNICLVKGSLGLNIITAIFSFVSFILNCLDLSISNYSFYGYYLPAGSIIVSAILLISNLLLFSVSISVSVFGCRSLCHSPSNAPQVFVVQNDAVGAAPPLYRTGHNFRIQ